MNKNLFEIQEKIGYEFKDKEILYQAMTHSSYVNDHGINKLKCNERLEFLGDAILELISSDFLYKEYPEKQEGELTKLRASLVSEQPLAAIARELNLGSYIFLSKGEDNMGGRERDSITSDAVEALLGAIYLDGGMEPARKFTLEYILKDIENKKLFYDSKTVLQEIVQKYKLGILTYDLVSEKGPDHQKTYEVNAMLDEKIIGNGEGRTKKSAQQHAAYDAIKKLNYKL